MDYDSLLAPAAKEMRPSGIRKFFDLAAEMPECISLGVGEPDFKTPWSVRDAAIRTLQQGRTRYTANAGMKELRVEICNYLARRFDLHYRQEVKRTFLIPGVASLIMALAVWLLYTPLENLMGNKPATLLCLVLAVLIYGFFVLFLRGITEEEMRAFPKGYLLVKVLKKIRLM